MGYIVITAPCKEKGVDEIWINTEHILYIQEDPEGRASIALPNNIIIHPKEDIGAILYQLRNPVINT